mgnify:CR=1 FL=1
MDDITPLQQWGSISQGAEAHLFDVGDARVAVRQVGLEARGVSFPGHFLVRLPVEGTPVVPTQADAESGKTYLAENWANAVG